MVGRSGSERWRPLREAPPCRCAATARHRANIMARAADQCSAPRGALVGHGLLPASARKLGDARSISLLLGRGEVELGGCASGRNQLRPSAAGQDARTMFELVGSAEPGRSRVGIRQGLLQARAWRPASRPGAAMGPVLDDDLLAAAGRAAGDARFLPGARGDRGRRGDACPAKSRRLRSAARSRTSARRRSRVFRLRPRPFSRSPTTSSPPCRCPRRIPPASMARLGAVGSHAHSWFPAN